MCCVYLQHVLSIWVCCECLWVHVFLKKKSNIKSKRHVGLPSIKDGANVNGALWIVSTLSLIHKMITFYNATFYPPSTLKSKLLWQNWFLTEQVAWRWRAHRVFVSRVCVRYICLYLCICVSAWIYSMCAYYAVFVNRYLCVLQALCLIPLYSLLSWPPIWCKLAESKATVFLSVFGRGLKFAEHKHTHTVQNQTQLCVRVCVRTYCMCVLGVLYPILEKMTWPERVSAKVNETSADVGIPLWRIASITRSHPPPLPHAQTLHHRNDLLQPWFASLYFFFFLTRRWRVWRNKKRVMSQHNSSRFKNVRREWSMESEVSMYRMKWH